MTTPDQTAVAGAQTALTAAIGQLETDTAAQIAALAAKDQADAAAAATANAALATTKTQLAASQAQVAVLSQELAALQHTSLPTRYGYSTFTGNWAADDALFSHQTGKGIARAYFTGDPTTLPSQILDGRALSLSFNTANMAGDLPGVVTWLTAFDQTAKPGTIVYLDPWHEYDHAEGGSPQTFISGMALFTPAMAALKPKLRNIVLFTKAMSTAYLFSGLSAHKPDDFALAGASVPDVFSIDCDGRDSTVAYHDFTPEVTAAVAFAAAAGYRIFAVDELGCGRIASDTSGAGRAQWYLDQAAMIVRVATAAGMVVAHICLWEYESFPRYQVTTGSPEAQAWAKQVALA